MQNVYVNEMCEPIPTSLTLKQMSHESNTELLKVTWIYLAQQAILTLNI